MHLRGWAVPVVLLTLPAMAEVESTDAVSPCLGVSTTANTTLSSVTVATGVTNPILVTAPPGDTRRIFIVEQPGRILIHPRGTPPTTLSTFLDISAIVDDTAWEMGLLGLVFDPGYASTLHFWVNYTETVGGVRYTVIARYTADPTNPDLANPASEVRILRFVQPEENHNGGMLTFGNDGYLYVFTGDGGGFGDQHGTCGNGQNKQALLGKVLRIDVRGMDPNAVPPDCGGPSGIYGVPSSNPFVDGLGGACDEVWAYGLRNPWRSSIDQLTGDLYIADVGQGCWEEINYAPTGVGGQNFGWRQMEGNHCYNVNDFTSCDPVPAICAGSPACQDPSITLPVHEFGHDPTCAVIGGFVYRGCKMPAFHGRYFYSDLCPGFVRTFRVVGGAATDHLDVSAQVDPTSALNNSVGSFGLDGQGEMYVASFHGYVLKFVPPFADLEVSAPGAGTGFALSRTGSWTWENLTVATDVPVSFYRVYRGTPGGSFICVFKALTAAWPLGGDPAVPGLGQLFGYVVTAVNANGQETVRGAVGTFDPATCP